MAEKQKVVVITGATRGIGKNIALYFAERGYLVAGTGRNEQLLLELEKQLREFSPQNRCFQMDVQNPESVKNAVEQIQRSFPTLDVWINNAGAFAAIGPTWEVNPQDWMDDVHTNLFGLFHCVQAVVPIMLKQGTGRIMSVVGGGTISEFKYGNGYGTSKTAIARFTENLSAELQGSGVLAFSLDPGLNDTDMTRSQREEGPGQKYFTDLPGAFLNKQDVPPDRAPSLAYLIAEGNFDAFQGRIVFVHEDPIKLQHKADELQNEDYYKLRMRSLDHTERD